MLSYKNENGNVKELAAGGTMGDDAEPAGRGDERADGKARGE